MVLLRLLLRIDWARSISRRRVSSLLCRRLIDRLLGGPGRSAWRRSSRRLRFGKRSGLLMGVCGELIGMGRLV
jgi:hypothetical protein